MDLLHNSCQIEPCLFPFSNVEHEEGSMDAPLSTTPSGLDLERRVSCLESDDCREDLDLKSIWIK